MTRTGSSIGPCLDALVALIDHLPAGFQIALAGRAEPDLHLARLRARRDLLEIGTSELALDVDETRRLTAAAGRSLTPDQAERAPRTDRRMGDGHLPGHAGRQPGRSIPAARP